MLTRGLTPRQLAHWRRDAETWKDTGRRDLPLPRPLERLIAAINNKIKAAAYGTAVVTFNTYVNGSGGSPFPPVGWWSMRATSGTKEPNRGAGGAALDMTILSATLGQTGKLGVNEAALCDALNTRYQTPNNAALAALMTFEYLYLVNPSSAGELDAGVFHFWGPNGANEGLTLRFHSASRNLNATAWNTTPSNFSSVTTTVASLAWQIIFASYANAGDRKPHVLIGIGGAVTECSYSSNPALTGTYRTPAQALNLFNDSAQALTFAGLADEALVVSGNLSAAQRTQITILTGV